jgi:hypothetical protein
MDWQPIETAPRDGRVILAALILARSHEVRPVQWDHQVGTWRVFPSGHWTSMAGWMPLPPPPA